MSNLIWVCTVLPRHIFFKDLCTYQYYFPKGMWQDPHGVLDNLEKLCCVTILRPTNSEKVIRRRVEKLWSHFPSMSKILLTKFLMMGHQDCHITTTVYNSHGFGLFCSLSPLVSLPLFGAGIGVNIDMCITTSSCMVYVLYFL